MQKYTINQCPECGSNDFILRERTTYKARVSKDGTLTSYDLEDYRIEKISCTECKSRYSVDDFMDTELTEWR